MDDLKTVEDFNPVDQLRSKQKEDVAKMRASLLSCTADPSTAQQSLQNIAVMRIYHQISRIIRYTELMDKLEEKLYDSIEHTIDTSDPARTTTWLQLMKIQETLQKNMIESHKLLQPYLDLKSYSIMDLAPQQETPSASAVILDADSREKIRSSAQAVLLQLSSGDEYE